MEQGHDFSVRNWVHQPAWSSFRKFKEQNDWEIGPPISYHLLIITNRGCHLPGLGVASLSTLTVFGLDSSKSQEWGWGISAMCSRPLVLWLHCFDNWCYKTLVYWHMEHENLLLVLASQRDSELNWGYIMAFVYLAAYAMDTFYKSETNVNIQICPNYTDRKIFQIPPKVKGSAMSFLSHGFCIEGWSLSYESPTSMHISGTLNNS